MFKVILITIIIFIVVIRILVLFKDLIKFFLTGHDYGFHFSEINTLWKLAKKCNLEDLSNIVGDKKQIIIRNFIAGVFRGIGIGIGITIITAILILMLKNLVALNIPVIGEYISDIVEIVEKSRWLKNIKNFVQFYWIFFCNLIE